MGQGARERIGSHGLHRSLKGHKMRKSIIAATLLLVGIPPASAIGFSCLEPNKPVCLDFSKVDESCRRSVEAYVRDGKSYVECLDREQDLTINEINAVIRKFNCKVEGKAYCF